MKNKIIAIVSVILVFLVVLSIGVSAITYETTVDISTNNFLVYNLNTSTVVYEKNVYDERTLSNLSVIMNALVVCDTVTDPDNTKITISESVLSKIYNSDNTLDKYVDQELSVTDLMTIMMITDGNDAAYVLADYITNGDQNVFLDMMKNKANELGCDMSNFVSVCPTNSSDQYSSCADILQIMKAALKYDSFRTASNASSFSINKEKGAEEEPDIETNNSIKKYSSPYYYSYVHESKFSYDVNAGQNIVAVSKYSNIEYIYIGLDGRNESELNVFNDVKHMISFVYTKLKDAKMLGNGSEIGTALTDTDFNQKVVPLTVSKDLVLTLPNDYVSSDLEYKYEYPERVPLPVYVGQNVGVGRVYFKGEQISRFNVVANANYGTDLLHDTSDIISNMFNQLMPLEPTEETSESTVAPSE